MRRTWIARAGDALFFGWLAFALVVDLTGGFRIGRGWYRITATDPLHLAGVAIVIVVVRHLLVWQPSLRTRLTARRAARGQPAVLVPGAVSPRQWLIATAFFLASTLWILHDQVWTITGLLDRGDPLFSMWRLAWIAHQIVADPRHLFDANIFHPALNTLAYSDATLLPGIVATPFLLAGVPVAVFHGLLYLASFLLAGLAMFGLTFAVTRSMVPALLAGLLFGFYPYRIATYSHLEMQGVFLMPMALLALLHVVDRVLHHFVVTHGGYSPDQPRVRARMEEVMDRFPMLREHRNRKAIELSPNDTQAQALLGWALMHQEKYDEALKVFQNVLSKQPDNSLARINIGYISFKKKSFPEAIEHLSRAIRLDNDRKATLYAHFYLGLVYLERDMFEDAQTFFEKTITLGPNLIEAYYELGRAYWFNGQQDEAMKEWKDGHTANKFNPWGKRCAEVLRVVAEGGEP